MPVAAKQCPGSSRGRCSCRGCSSSEAELSTAAPAAPSRLQTTITGFSRYSNAVRALPPSEQRKIEEIAKAVVSSLAGRGGRIHRIGLVGHADTDTPPRPSFEMQISLARAKQVRSALSYAIDRNAALLPGPAQLPPFSSRVAWHVS